MRTKSLLATTAGLLVVAGLGATWKAVRPDRPPSLSDRATDRAPSPDPDARQDPRLFLAARTRGADAAPLTIYEVSDFQCPYCRMFWERTLPVLEREYIATGKVKLIFLNLPLVQIHPNAAAAHEFAMCAATQDQFWAAHDLLFRHQERWSALADPGPFLLGLADSLPLSRSAFDTCIQSGQMRELIIAEAQMTLRAGIQSTPSFVIEQGILAGAQPIDVWRPLLDSLLDAKVRKPE